MKFTNKSGHPDSLLRYLTMFTLGEIKVDPAIIREITFHKLKGDNSSWHGIATFSPKPSKPTGTIEIWVAKTAKPRWRFKFPFVWRRKNIREAIVEAVAHEAMHIHTQSIKHMPLYRAERYAVKQYRKKHR